MKKIESNGYANQYGSSQQYGNGQQRGNGNKSGGNGLLTIVMMVVMVAVVLMAMNSMNSKNDSTNTTVTPPIVINVPDTSGNTAVSNTSLVGTEEKEEETVTVPVSEKYAIQGNYYKIFTQTNDVTDNFGNTYDTANVAVVGINACSKKLTYDLDGSYTTLRGTVALSEKDKDDINFVKVYVYNEKGECFYQSKEISAKSPDPIEVNCNITGMTRITIELEGCDRTCGSVEVIMPDEGFVFEGPASTVASNN